MFADSDDESLDEHDDQKDDETGPSDERLPMRGGEDVKPQGDELPSAVAALRGGPKEDLLTVKPGRSQEMAVVVAKRRREDDGTKAWEAKAEALETKLTTDMKKRRKEFYARDEAKVPAYERDSMHGQKIVIAVGPSSLPQNSRITYGRIPHKDFRH